MLSMGGVVQPSQGPLRHGVLVIRQDLIAKMDFLIWIKTFQVLSSCPIGRHTNGQPHGSTIGKLDNGVFGGYSFGVLAEEPRFRAAAKRDSSS
jgi:hypothetical protein